MLQLSILYDINCMILGLHTFQMLLCQPKEVKTFLLQLILDRRAWKVRKAFGRLERGPRADHLLVKIERQIRRLFGWT